MACTWREVVGQVATTARRAGYVRIAFVYIAEPYQCYHVAAVAHALARRPTVSVEIFYNDAETVPHLERIRRAFAAPEPIVVCGPLLPQIRRCSMHGRAERQHVDHHPFVVADPVGVDQAFDKRWKTKIGSFRYSECVQAGAGGTITGTITAQAGGAPLAGATAQLGARSATTNASGVYSFTGIVPALWLNVKLVGAKANRDGIGAVVRVQSAAGKQWNTVRSGSSYCSASDLSLVFGLGTAATANVDVEWPSGARQQFNNVNANQFVTIDETKGIVKK